jgi:hypothetical protein
MSPPVFILYLPYVTRVEPQAFFSFTHRRYFARRGSSLERHIALLAIA